MTCTGVVLDKIKEPSPLFVVFLFGQFGAHPGEVIRGGPTVVLYHRRSQLITWPGMMDPLSPRRGFERSIVWLTSEVKFPAGSCALLVMCSLPDRGLQG